MRRVWTKLEKVLVFYYARNGLFAIDTHLDTSILRLRDLISYIGHSEKSFWLIYNKFASKLNAPINERYEVYYLSKGDYELFNELSNLTVMQLRDYMADLIAIQKEKESDNTNISEKEESALKASYVQLSFNFDEEE